ncbi:hypothetical protein [Allorhizocola rhizosphaerae]|uniref:hypothetical protein n=1 Tax=Allorhizocola rhizosphaerae TaxID=1872709 RepID=UPI0013C2C6FF|nr:hypothetical protein [Allorhizocola rhizosphaerae]
MVGVSDPLWREDRRHGLRFLGGFAVGSAVAAAVLSMPLLLLTEVAAAINPTVRAVALVALLLGLGVADLLNRTPHVWRQVPQRFARTLPPGRLGLIWAIDLGLLVTTQKTTSLLWIGLGGLVLAGSPVPVLLAAMVVSMVFAAGVVLLTVARIGSTLTDPLSPLRIRAQWVPWLRRASGATAVALAGFEIARLL